MTTVDVSVEKVQNFIVFPNQTCEDVRHERADKSSENYKNSEPWSGFDAVGDDLPDDYVDFDFMRPKKWQTEGTSEQEHVKHPQNISFYSKLMEFTVFFRFCRDAAAQINIFKLVGE